MAKTCFIHFVISFKEHQLRLIDFKIKNYLAMALVPCVDLLRLQVNRCHWCVISICLSALCHFGQCGQQL